MYPPSYPGASQPTQPGAPQPTPTGLPAVPDQAPYAPTIPGAAASPSGASGGYPAAWGQSPYATPGLPPTPPTLPPPGAPQPNVPGPTMGLRLTGLGVALVVLVAIIASTSTFAVASARSLAYPHPIIGFNVSNSTASIHIGDDVVFAANAISGHDLSYAWDFGDGATASGARVDHTFQQNGQTTVTLTATDPIGQTAQATQSLNVLFGLPTATFTYQPDLTNFQCGVDFDGSASGGQNLSFAWNFGNGDTSQDISPSEGYAQAGTYQVTLTVTDGDNQTATDTQSVVVDCVAAPVASFVYTPDPFYTCGIDFDATASSGSGLNNYAWAFGDGNTGSGETTTWQYVQAGSYNVTLTVTDQYGQTGTTSQSVNVSC